MTDALKIAVLGEGVIGMSAALAIRRAFRKANLTLISDRDFTDTTSYGPAGIFRVDSNEPRNRRWAADTFAFWAQTERLKTPLETGIQHISGYLQCDDRTWLEQQETCMADLVYNWHWLNERELSTLFEKPSKFGVHYSAYAAEGRLYVPWLRAQLEAESPQGSLQFHREAITSVQELADSARFDVVVNCAGLDGGRLAGDDQSVYPNRGVALEVDAPGHGHFSYRGRDIFCIPLVTSGRLLVGTLREDNCWSREVTDRDKEFVWSRFVEFHPNFKDAKLVSTWCGLRPNRKGGVRLEHVELQNNKSKGNVHVIHNYGHASNGMLLGWGCGLEVAEMIKKLKD